MESNNTFNTSDINPWKGLNFYKEGDVIYGRKEEIYNLSQYILNNTQTVLYGKSGIGKSSIINAGVFPEVRKSGLFPISLRLNHNGESYVNQIKIAIESSGIGIKEFVKPINTSEETLWEYLHRNVFYDKKSDNEDKQLNKLRPLLVFDQFEEIFTLQKSEANRKNFFSQLADLINEVIPQYIVDKQADNSTNQVIGSNGISLDFGSKTDEIYEEGSFFNLVFVIREDFLSYLERYTTYIPAMKMNRFSLQGINEEQAREIITQPQPGLIEDNVAKLIISRITGCKENEFSFDGVPELEVDSAVLSLFLSRLFMKKEPSAKSITVEHVNKYSADIIKDFYVEAVSKIDDEKISYLEDELINSEGRRENISKFNAQTKGHITDSDIKILVEEEKVLRMFPYGNDFRLEFIHDVLCPIIVERKSRRAQLLEFQRRQKRNRSIMISIVACILSLGVMGYIWWHLKYKTIKEYCIQYELRYGFPVPVNENFDKTKTPLYYCLLKKGSRTQHYTDIEIMSSNENLPNTPRINTVEIAGEDTDDKFALAFNNLLSKSTWFIK